MSTWVMVIVGILMIYGMTHGLLMLISPAKHRKFNLRLSDPFGRLKWKPDDDGSDGLELGYRLTGLGILVICSLIAWGSLLAPFAHYFQGSSSRHGAALTIALGKKWWGFVAAGGCFLFGAYAFLFPLHVYQWSVKRMVSSNQELPEPSKIRKGNRFLGICFIILGAVSFWLELMH